MTDIPVSIIIVNYNGKNLLKDCLDSVFRQEYKSFEIIFVDNASTDGSAAFVKINYPSVRIIRNPENYGFAKANNIGVLNSKNDYTVLLNNDTVVDKNWLTELVRAAQEKNIAVAGSRIVTDGVPEKYYNMNGTINLLGYNVMDVFKDLTQTFSACGGSLLFKKNLIGLPFDDEYFLYSEDVFLSWKARIAGYDVRLAPESVVYHRGSFTTRRENRTLIVYQQNRNRILNLLLFYEVSTLISLAPLLILDALVKIFFGPFKGSRFFIGIIKSYFWILKNPGKIIKMRKIYQKKRNITDDKIIKFMSCRIFSGDRICHKMFNLFSCGYCRIMKIKTADFYGEI